MRVKSGVKNKKRRTRVLKKTEGFRGRSRNTMVAAMQALDRAMAYNYRDRKALKRDMRGLWITRITAAVRSLGFSYSRFIKALKDQNIEINRKMLAELAATDPKVFDAVVKASKVAA